MGSACSMLAYSDDGDVSILGQSIIRSLITKPDPG